MRKTNIDNLNERKMYIDMIHYLGKDIMYLAQFRKLLNVFGIASNAYQENKILKDLEAYAIIDYDKTDVNQKIVCLTTKAVRYITEKKYARAVNNVEESIKLSELLVAYHLKAATLLKKIVIDQGKDFNYVLYKKIGMQRADATFFKNFDGINYFNLLESNGFFYVNKFNLSKITDEVAYQNNVSPSLQEKIKFVRGVKKRMLDTEKKREESMKKALGAKSNSEEKEECKRNLVLNKTINYVLLARNRNAEQKEEKASNTDVCLDFNSLFTKNVYIASIIQGRMQDTHIEIYRITVNLFDVYSNYIDEEMIDRINEIDLFLKSIYDEAYIQIKYNVYTRNILTEGILGYDVNINYIED